MTTMKSRTLVATARDSRDQDQDAVLKRDIAVVAHLHNIINASTVNTSASAEQK
jgi:hypothetical protein